MHITTKTCKQIKMPYFPLFLYTYIAAHHYVRRFSNKCNISAEYLGVQRFNIVMYLYHSSRRIECHIIRISQYWTTIAFRICDEFSVRYRWKPQENNPHEKILRAPRRLSPNRSLRHSRTHTHTHDFQVSGRNLVVTGGEETRTLERRVWRERPVMASPDHKNSYVV